MMEKAFLQIGLTGGIASGKSTVSRILSELGVPVIDADAFAHRLVESDGKAFHKVLEHFGPSILEGDRISRKKLAERVFQDRNALQELNAILHPLIIVEMERVTKELLEKKKGPIIITEAALLIETEYYKRFDRIIVVSCSLETQIERLMVRDRMNRGEALARINSQMPLDEKAQYANYIIDTNCPLSEVKEKTKELYIKLIEDSKKLSKSEDT
jgi:dephospho-CoA kinase